MIRLAVPAWAEAALAHLRRAAVLAAGAVKILLDRVPVRQDGAQTGPRPGLGFVVGWIAALTLVMSAAAAWLKAGSAVAAILFLIAGMSLAPPVQAMIARLRHKLAPAKVAFYAVITLVPIGLLFVAIDGVATMDREARRRGFASAGHMARAHDLGYRTAEALAAYDEARGKAALERRCSESGAKRPLECFEPAHRASALAYATALLVARPHEEIVREAIGQQRKAFLAADRNCAALLDRIDEDALPVLLAEKQELIGLLAAILARHLSGKELAGLAQGPKPAPTPTLMPELEQRVVDLAPQLDRELVANLQAQARRIVAEEPTWRTFLKGRGPLGTCKPADAPAKE